MKTGVMSANFKLPGNLPVYIDSFKSFCNILALASELILSIFGGVMYLVDDLSLISFTTLLKVTGSNENLF